MSGEDSDLWELTLLFTVLSCFAVGGINPILPEVHRQVVDVHGWMTTNRFTDLFAIAQAAPGPNISVVTLIGWEVAGAAGAFAATLAMIGPTSVLAYVVGRVWDRFRYARWRLAVQAGLVPVTIGLVAASAYVLAREVDKSLAALLVTALTAIGVYATRLHPLLFLLGGAVAGMAGLL